RGQPVSSVSARWRAYWLLWSMRRVMPKRSTWRVMQFDTLRLRLVKIAARVVELKTQLKIHLVERPRSGDLCHAPRPLAASGHLRNGADAPELTCSPSTSSAYPLATKKTTAGVWIGTPTRPAGGALLPCRVGRRGRPLSPLLTRSWLDG